MAIDLNLSRRELLADTHIGGEIGHWYARFQAAQEALAAAEAILQQAQRERRAALSTLRNAPVGTPAEELAHLPAKIAMLDGQITRMELELVRLTKDVHATGTQFRVQRQEYRIAIAEWNALINLDDHAHQYSPGRWLRTLQQHDATIERYEGRACLNGQPIECEGAMQP